MRTLVRNRRRERRPLPQMEARRRKRRAANVNSKRWLDRAHYFMGRAAELGMKARAFAWMAELPDEGTEKVGPVAVQYARNLQAQTEVANARFDDCYAKARAWADRSPV